jgi:hypothetical protein
LLHLAYNVIDILYIVNVFLCIMICARKISRDNDNRNYDMDAGALLALE